MLVNEGRLSLADRWISYFPEYEGEIADERFRNVTVRNLLTMTMGQESDLSYIGAGDDWHMRFFIVSLTGSRARSFTTIRCVHIY